MKTTKALMIEGVVGLGIGLLFMWFLFHMDHKERKNLKDQGYTPTQVDSVINKHNEDTYWWILLAG